MCFYTRGSRIRIATKDIVCYKRPFYLKLNASYLNILYILLMIETLNI